MGGTPSCYAADCRSDCRSDCLERLDAGGEAGPDVAAGLPKLEIQSSEPSTTNSHHNFGRLTNIFKYIEILVK